VRLRSLPWTPAERGAAKQVGDHLDRVLVRRAEERAELAATLQRALLLEELPEVTGATLIARYRPAGDAPVGGDWYDVFFLPDGRTVLALGDVAGHGIAVAPIMAQLRHAVRAYVLQSPSPGVAMGRLGELLDWLLPTELASLVLADFTPSTRRLRVANAGHLPPLLVRPGAGAELLALDKGPALGLSADAEYRDAELELPPGSSIVLYSDGLVERRGEALDEAMARLLDAASDVERGGDLHALCDRLVAMSAADDDVTLLALRSDASEHAPG
jgi:serine phosphatase RsbU (regulator of sigma subunit)